MIRVGSVGEFWRLVEAELERRLAKVTTTLVTEHKKALGKRYPRASVPGEFPAKRTGNLQASVASEHPSRFLFKAGYEPAAPYVVHLHQAMRRVLADTAVTVLPKLRRAAEGK